MADFENEKILGYEPFTSNEAMIKSVGYEETPDTSYVRFKSMIEQGKDYNFLIDYYANYIPNSHTSFQVLTSLLKLNNKASLERYLSARTKHALIFKQGTPYVKGAIVMVYKGDNVLFYVSQKDNNTDDYTTSNWKVCSDFFNFEEWATVTYDTTNKKIILTHNGVMKFDTAYLRAGLVIKFPCFNNTNSSFNSIEIDGISIGLITIGGGELGKVDNSCSIEFMYNGSNFVLCGNTFAVSKQLSGQCNYFGTWTTDAGGHNVLKVSPIGSTPPVVTNNYAPSILGTPLNTGFSINVYIDSWNSFASTGSYFNGIFVDADNNQTGTFVLRSSNNEPIPQNSLRGYIQMTIIDDDQLNNFVFTTSGMKSKVAKSVSNHTGIAGVLAKTIVTTLNGGTKLGHEEAYVYSTAVGWNGNCFAYKKNLSFSSILNVQVTCLGAGSGGGSNVNIASVGNLNTAKNGILNTPLVVSEPEIGVITALWDGAGGVKAPSSFFIVIEGDVS